MPTNNELLNEIETELFSETESTELESQKVCEHCGNQPCTCNKSTKVCEQCGKTPCQCNKSHKSNNSTKDNTMALFDDPELNSLFAADAHAPGEGADAGKEAKDPNVTEGEIAGAVACGKKCKSVEEQLWSDDGDDPAPAGDDGEKAADDTVDGEAAEEAKKKKGGKKCKSDVADLFSDELFNDKKKPEVPAGDDDSAKGDDDEDEDDEEAANEAAEFDLELASEEAELDLDI